jgi:DNA polymerase-3 subunit epsilon
VENLNFTSIDFETANEKPDSVCSLGIVKVKNGEIVDRRYRLIRPPEMRFSWRNIQVHGIQPEDVAGEPEFGSYGKSILNLLGEGPVIAHNAEFDFGVLRAALQRYKLPFPDLKYSCSLRIARRVWKALPSYSLGPLAQSFGIRFEHHHALEDAEAAAKVVLRAVQDTKTESLEDLNELAGVQFGRLRSDNSYRPVRSRPKKRTDRK